MSRVRSLMVFVPPQLPSLIEQPPEGAGWIHEVKHDGYRTLLAIHRSKAVAYTRNGYDWSTRYPHILAAAVKLRCLSAMLDGEVIVQDERGISDFDALQEAIKSRPGQLIFYAFDLLHLDGIDLRNRPLIERRAKLRKLIDRDPGSRLQFSDEFVGDAAALYRACAAQELEGIVSKLTNSRYRSGRSTSWLKTKCFEEGEFTLLGIDQDRKTKAPRALLAKAEAGHLVYAGAAFLGLCSQEREHLSAKLEKLTVEAPSLPWLRNRDAKWVRPEIQCRVKHLVGARFLRHATVRAVS